MSKKKRKVSLALTLAFLLAMTSFPYSVGYAQESSESGEENDSSSEITSIEISDNSEDSIEKFKEAVNNVADGDEVTILLTAEPAEGESEVVFPLDTSLTVASGASVTITGTEGVTYSLQANSENAITADTVETGYTGFLHVNGTLTLTNVTVDANELGRVVVVANGTLDLAEDAVIQNGLLSDSTKDYGAGIYVSDGTVTMGEGCIIQSCITGGRGAGIYINTGTVTMEAGSKVSDNRVDGQGAAYGGGIYNNTGTLEMKEGSCVKNNRVLSSTTTSSTAVGGGIVNNKGNLIMAGTVSGNTVEQINTEKAQPVYAAGIYDVAGSDADVRITGTISNNKVTAVNANGVYGAGIFIKENHYLVGATVTGNTIEAESITGTASGAGVYVYGNIYIGGDLQIKDNYVGDETDSNVYMYKDTYLLTVTEALSDDAEIYLYRPLASDVTESQIVVGYTSDSEDGKSVELSEADLAKFHYEPQTEDEADYGLVYNEEDQSIYLTSEMPEEDSVIEIPDTTDESIEKLTNAVNNAADGDEVTILLTAEPAEGESEVVFPLDTSLTVASGASVTITGTEGVTYSIQANSGDAIIADTVETSYKGFLHVNGNLTLTNVTIDVNELGRAVVVAGGTLELAEDAVIQNGLLSNSTTDYGAGIYVSDGTVTMGEGCIIQSCITGGRGAGIYINTGGTVTMENGSKVSGNLVDGIKAAWGGGIYNNAGTLEMKEGSLVENNRVVMSSTSSTAGAGGAGITNYGDMIMSGTVSGNTLEKTSTSTTQSINAAGIYDGAGSSANVWITGAVTGNTVTADSARYVFGSGVYISADHYLVDATITGNTIEVDSIYGTAMGAGVYIYMSASETASKNIYIGGDLQVKDNYIGTETDSNIYMTTEALYLTVTEALSDDAEIHLYRALASDVTESQIVVGYTSDSEDGTSVELSEADLAKFHYEPQTEDEADYGLVYNEEDQSIYLTSEMPEEEPGSDEDSSAGDTLMVRRGNVFWLSYSNVNTEADLTFSYGLPDDEVLIGDWDGDGVDTICVRRDNTYYFTNQLGDIVTADDVIDYGRATDEALVGDWDGDGVDTLCLRRGNTYYFYNDLNSTRVSSVLTYGKSSDEVLVGDWNNDGVDTLCVRRGNVYYFSNGLENTVAEVTLRYGKSSDEVLVGDWNDDGADTLCIRRGNKYYFSNDLESETAASKLSYGKSTDEVYVGRWQ